MGPTETRALELAEALTAQSDALDAQAAAKRLADHGATVTVTRPEDEPTVADRRRWALQEARMRGHDVLRPGGPPREHYVVAGPDSAAVVKAQMPRQVVWGPDTAGQAEREWSQRIRERENEILIAAYGLKACRKAGLL